MPGSWLGYAIGIAAILFAAGGLYYAFKPQPVPVDTAVISRDAMSVTIDEEGVTRIKDIYRVPAPVAGKVLRSPVHVGDKVAKDVTIVAVIQPASPTFIDIRTRRELEAAAAAARAAVKLSQAEVQKAEYQLDFARRDLERAETLSRKETISQRSLDKARLDVTSGEAALDSAKAQLELRKREWESAQAKLIGPEQNNSAGTSARADCCIEIKAPADGAVLKIFNESEQVVQSGSALVEIGDPGNIEITADLLSSDAVRVRPGASVAIEGWGNDARLTAEVSYIEPAGFTKTSALGIEEQRVRVIFDLIGDSTAWSRLGHDYRVYVRINAWRGENVLKVPLGALFRSGQNWAVYRLVDGRAVETAVEIGHRNNEAAELLNGASEGDIVILHPSDRVSNGVLAAPRTRSN